MSYIAWSTTAYPIILGASFLSRQLIPSRAQPGTLRINDRYHRAHKL
jgi:hypothetical protein